MKSNKNCIRDALTGKKLSSNKEVISIENAIDWVKKQGFIVIRPTIKEVVSAVTYSFIVCFLFILLVGTLGHATINVVGENNTGNYPNILVYNNALLIANISLVYNTENCLTNCQAIINFTTTQSLSLPNSFDFTDKNKNSKTIPYKIYYWNNSVYSINKSYDYCITYTGNNCTSIGHKNMTENNIYGWQLYSGQTFNAGRNSIKIEGIKQINDSIDWGFAFQGVGSDVIRNYWAWWNSSFANCINITAEGATSNLNGFVLYKELNMTNLNSYINSTTGKNVRFVNSSCNNGGTEMPYEVDNINSSQVGYWIKGDIKTSSQVWSAYIDSDNKNTNYENPTSVWTDYIEVYHFQEGSGTNAHDSTINSNNITLSNSNLWVNNGDAFGKGLNWSADYIGTSIKVSGISGNMNRTIMAFYDNPIPITANGRILFDIGISSANQDFILGDWDGSHTGKWMIGANTGGNDYKPATLTINSGVNFMSAVHNGTANIYQNKTYAGTGFSHTYNTASVNITLGNVLSIFAGYYWRGGMDEFRISNQTLSKDYLDRTYDNYLYRQSSMNSTIQAFETESPTFHEIILPDGQTWSNSNSYFFSVDVNNTNGTVKLSLDVTGLNYSLILNSTDDDNDSYYVFLNNLSAGLYNATFITYAFNPPHRMNQTSQLFVINQANQPATFILNQNGTTYGSYINFSCFGGINTANVSYQRDISSALFQNYTSLQNQNIIIEARPNPNYAQAMICDIVGNQNYSAFYGARTFTMNKAIPNLIINGTGSFNNGTETFVSGLNCPAQLICNLYLNNTLVSNPDIENFSVGNYLYIFNTTGNNNYSAYSVNGTINIGIPSSSSTLISLFTFDFTKMTNIVIFIFAFILSVVIMIYLSWETGCILILAEGIVLLINIDNKLIGLIVIILSVLSAFVPKNK